MATYEQLLQMLNSQLGDRSLFGDSPGTARWSGYQYGNPGETQYYGYGSGPSDMVNQTMQNYSPEQFLQGLMSGSVSAMNAGGGMNAMPWFNPDPSSYAPESVGMDQVAQMLQQFGFNTGMNVGTGGTAVTSPTPPPDPTQQPTTVQPPPQLPPAATDPGSGPIAPTIVPPGWTPPMPPEGPGGTEWDPYPQPGGGTDNPTTGGGDNYPYPPWGGGGGPGAYGGPPPWYPPQPYPGGNSPPPGNNPPPGGGGEQQPPSNPYYPPPNPYTGVPPGENQQPNWYDPYNVPFPGPYYGPGSPSYGNPSGEHDWRQDSENRGYNWETEAFHNRMYGSNQEMNNAIPGSLNPAPWVNSGLEQFYSNAMPSATRTYNDSLWGLSGQYGFSPNMDRTNYGMDYVMGTAPDAYGWWAKGAANNQEMDFARWVMNNNPEQLLASGQITSEQLANAIQANNSIGGKTNQMGYNLATGQTPMAGQDLSGMMEHYPYIMQSLTAGPGGQGGGWLDAMNTAFSEGLPTMGNIDFGSGSNNPLIDQLINNPNGYNPYDSLNAVMGKEGIANVKGDPSKGTTGVVESTQAALQNANQLLGGPNGGMMGWLSNIFEHGPPGQQSDISDRGGLEGLQGELTNLGRSGMGGAIGAAQEQMQRGGLTDEYVQAMMRQVLEPSQRQLTEKLNAMSGGRANLGTSGASQFPMEQLQQDFNDSLIRTGMENYQGSMGLLGQLGSQAGGQATDIFGQVMSNAMQPINASANLQNQLFQQGLGGTQLPSDLSRQWTGLGHDMITDLRGQDLQELALQAQQGNQAAQNQLQLMGMGSDTALKFGDQYQNLGQYGLQRELMSRDQYGKDMQRAMQSWMLPSEQGANMTNQMYNAMLQTSGMGQQQEQMKMDNLFKMLTGGQAFLGQGRDFGANLSQQNTNLMQALLTGQMQRDQIPGVGIGDIAAMIGILLSSIRFKDDVQELKSHPIDALRPVTYRYKPEIDPKREKRVGLIAEEVAEIYPDLVEMGSDGKPLGIRYMDLVPILISEIQSLRQRIQEIEDK